ncbi:MAG TPA: tripartite tricarboxylate transporter TctB family protein [Ramlibacter sp.]|uniref:tripartite tricarboxylate transporter TctB family protein n=1 Tax=Ramlibacter sp. TaxID=1917967 RepID=UPI002B6DF140|nr:tripartite tricarboxylate transporter TctB family protein [Ramlibacter sp.]HVZ47078.1 tripartite tricarboxylate transporter TctB family protein [Ramlibacter sp.]
MNDRTLVRGLFLMAIALAFGLTSFKYPIGEFGRAGPGLFPLIVSGLLLLVGIATVIRSRFSEAKTIDFRIKNIAVIMGSLAGFALLSEFVNMIVGIVFLVFCASLAATSYSTMRNVKIAAVLVAIAFAFYKFLGVNLPLY